MSDPMLAEALNPRLAAQRRMETEGQAPPVLRDPRIQPPPQPVGRFGKQFTPEQRLLQQMMLSKFLRERAAASAPTP